MMSMTELLLTGLGFATVGTAGTIIDFGVFLLLTHRMVGMRRIPANVLSVALAMTFSFVLNRNWVFRNPAGAADQKIITEIVAFLAVTLFSGFVLQNAVLRCWEIRGGNRSKWWSERIRRTLALSENLGGVCERVFVKGTAVFVGMFWNFFWYRYFVFHP